MKSTAPDDPNGARGPLIDAIVAKARLALVWEGAWPWLAAALGVVVLFLAASWFGLWDALHPLGRMAGVALFALAFLAALAPLLRLAAPDRRTALARVDRESGLAHRPATSLDDRLSATTEDPLTRALWRAHRARIGDDAKRLRAGAPAPRLAVRDPYALRFLLGLVAVAAFVFAGADRGDRVRAAFDWTTPAAEVVPARVDAWVAPPAYTGRPPIFLTARPGARPADQPAAAVPDNTPEILRAPIGSVVVVRGSGGSVEITATGAAAPEETPGKAPEGLIERRFKLTGDAELRIAAAGAPERMWRFSAIPDEPPSIRLSGEPQPNARGTTTIAYEVKDDYGIASAEARFVLKPPPGDAPPKPATAEAAAPAAKRPLYEAPKLALALPKAKAREGKADTALDTMEHPFAGAWATMTLTVRDEAGQEGASAPRDIRLPARSFTKPLARALVEQRRILAMDANAKPRVLQALRALTAYPEEFTPQAGIYLGLTTAYRRLENAVSDDELRGAADYLWEIALRIEDGDLPEAERNLRAAEQALRKALENGASEQEIQKLTQDLRAALEKFMQEMAQQAQKQNQGQPPQQGQNGAREVHPQDLRDMVDRMEKLAKQGSRDAAQQALADLRKMLDNLQNAQRQQADPDAQAKAEQMNKLQDMIREQSKLRDKTFQQYRQNDRVERNQRGKSEQGRQTEGEQAMKDLAQQQQALRDKLDQLMKQMQEGQGQQGKEPGQRQGQKKGGQPGPKGEQQGEQGEGEQPGQAGQAAKDGRSGEEALGDAGESMGEAKGALGQGETGDALDQQQKALENLRKGAQAMAEQMQGKGKPGQKGQQGEQGAQNGEDGRDDDPLGRPSRRRESDGNATKVPGEIDAQRARQVLDELRRRLGDSDRSREEIDYLERLLTP
ncbi:TIGR02302 family protein [Hansschlegelia plantiphila]|uniref:TIGR02302 family protein n=1 Tax=Hansschlegelia plantiphila TaxID=374655 RepID=UPI0022F26B04|nr:TIGR02302 family protein [Hansschlegelia plantiphila]